MGPPHVPLYSLPGAPGHVTWRAARRRPGCRRGAAAAGGVRAQRALPERPALLRGQRVCRLLGVHRADERAGLANAGSVRTWLPAAHHRALHVHLVPARLCGVRPVAGPGAGPDSSLGPMIASVARAADGRPERRQAGLARRLPPKFIGSAGPGDMDGAPNRDRPGETVRDIAVASPHRSEAGDMAKKKDKHEPHDAEVPASSAMAGQEAGAGPSSKMKRREYERCCLRPLAAAALVPLWPRPAPSAATR